MICSVFNFIISVEKSGVLLKKNWGPTMCKISVDLGQIQTSIANISERILDSVGYISAADSMRLSSFKCSWRAPKDARST